jgi:hypothetical protein
VLFKALQRPITIAGAFFVPARVSYGSCAWDVFGRAGFLDSRFTTLRTAVTHSCGNESVAAPDIKDVDHENHQQSVQNLALPTTQFPIA